MCLLIDTRFTFLVGLCWRTVSPRVEINQVTERLTSTRSFRLGQRYVMSAYCIYGAKALKANAGNLSKIFTACACLVVVHSYDNLGKLK